MPPSSVSATPPLRRARAARIPAAIPFLLSFSFAAAAAVTSTPFPVAIEVEAGRVRGPLKPVYRFFGADEPNYATMKDGRRLLRDIGALGQPQAYFRTHNLLNTGDGTPALKWGSTNAYTEDASGRARYDWTIVDRIFDTYLAAGVKPYAQIGFMPQALSTRPEPYQHAWRPGFPYNEIYTGWAYPPKDYAKWAELVFQWVRHCVERYGAAEVEKWYWEVWNEPNIGYWKGTPEEFRRLHDFAIDAVRRALPTARVGGPDTAGDGGKFMEGFLEHCLRGRNHATGRIGTPLDFIAFHAKGTTPVFLDGHVRMGLGGQLKTIDAGFARVARYPELKGTPIIIGESDPDGCAACQGPHLGYRNGTMYSSYTAAAFARKHLLAEKHGVNFEGATTWAFEFEDQPYFAGFRVMASNGLTLPVFNVHRMMARMSGDRLAARSSADVGLDALLASSVRAQPDVAALAALDRTARRLTVLVWHYHDDDVAGPEAAVSLVVTGLPDEARTPRLTHYRVDDQHSNAYSLWKALGSPLAPSRAQYAQLEAAAQLATYRGPAATFTATGNQAQVAFPLPRQAVSLLVLEW
ncbi:MAG: beta-xylosidase [Verrucomicrobia bacterium]|nr:beta-xylosidase [Verrucomicrobiota bacterium]